jgi:hypothetical protein
VSVGHGSLLPLHGASIVYRWLIVLMMGFGVLGYLFKKLD